MDAVGRLWVHWNGLGEHVRSQRGLGTVCEPYQDAPTCGQLELANPRRLSADHIGFALKKGHLRPEPWHLPGIWGVAL